MTSTGKRRVTSYPELPAELLCTPASDGARSPRGTSSPSSALQAAVERNTVGSGTPSSASRGLKHVEAQLGWCGRAEQLSKRTCLVELSSKDA